MKRKIVIISGIVLLIFGLIAVLPFLYKDKLLSKVKATLNSQINATIDFSDFKLSVFSQFPKVEMKLQNLSLIGVGEFSKDTILSASSISTNISLMDLIRSNDLELKSLTIENPKIVFIANEKGAVNWDIARASDSPSSSSSSSSSESSPVASAEDAFKMKLNDIRVNNLNLLYDDREMPMKVWVKNSTLTSTGNVDGTLSTFDLKGEVSEFILEYDSVQYISKTKLKAETNLKVDTEKMNFAFEQGKLWINSLPLEVNGFFEMPNDSMLFDLDFGSEKSDFATILALVPADYQKYIEKADIKGSAEFKGSVKGLFFNEIYPAIDVLLAVTNASFKYQDLTESIQDIQVSAQISKPEGDLNLLKVNVEKAHASIKNNPVDLRMALSELMTDPNIDASFSGTIDFASLKQALPIDSLDITGILKAQMQLAGRMSAIENQQYDKFQSNGEASLRNFRIESNRLTKPIEISQGQIKANAKQITVDQFDGKIGQSDFSLRGDVSNYLAYLFRNEVLKGDFNLKSAFLNLSELSNIQKPEQKQSASAVENKSAPVASAVSVAPTDSVVAFQVPEKLDLNIQSTIQRAVFDKIPLSNISGIIKVKDQRLDLTNLVMDILQGKLTVNGSYTSTKENKPLFDFKMNLENVDLPSAFQSIPTFQRYMPIAGKSQGKISTQFGLSGVMNEKMRLIPTSLNGLGVLTRKS